MPAHAFDFENDAHIPLLGYAHQCDGRVEARNHPLGNRSSLVEYQANGPATLCEESRDRDRAVGASQFLVVTENEIERPAWPKAFCKKILHSFENREEAEFVIQTSPAPDEAAFDDGGVGRMNPIPLAAFVHRNHILVGQQDRAGQTWIATRPAKEQAVLGNRLPLEFRMNPRIMARQVGAKGGERFVVHALAGLQRNGGNAQPAAKALEHRGFVECFWRPLRGNGHVLLEHRCTHAQHQPQERKRAADPSPHDIPPVVDVQRDSPASLKHGEV